MKILRLTIPLFLMATALMAGCANINSSPAASAGTNQVGEGTIEVIGFDHGNSRTGTGAVGGGVVGDAVVGEEIETGNRPDTGYRIQVRMDSGDRVIMAQDRTDGLRVGDRVQIENDRVYNHNENRRARRQGAGS